MVRDGTATSVCGIFGGTTCARLFCFRGPSAFKAQREANTKIESDLAAVKSRIGEIDQEIAALKGEEPASEDADSRVKALNDEKAALQAREKELAAEKATNDDVIAALSNSLDSAATGSSASSATPVQITLPGAQSDMTKVAEAVTRIVQAIDDNDFGPSICLHRLARQGANEAAKGRRDELSVGDVTRTISEGSAPGISEHCGGVLEAYVDYLKTHASQARAKAYVTEARAKMILDSDASPGEKAKQLADLAAEDKSTGGIDLGLFGGKGIAVPAPAITLPGN